MTIEELSARIERIEQQLAASPLSPCLSADEVAQARKRIAEIIASTEAAQRKADDEALRAQSAKLLCEEHAKSTAAVRGQVDVEFNTINSVKLRCEETERALGASRTVADDAIRTVTTSRDAVQHAQAWVTQNLPQLEAYAHAVSSAKVGADAALHDVVQCSADAKVAFDEVGRTRDQSTDILRRISDVGTNSDANAARIAELKSSIAADKAQVSERVNEIIAVAEELKKQHSSILDYRHKLEALIAENTELNKTAEKLLPHTASAGLASAFREQKSRFKSPQKFWLNIFAGTLILIFLVSVPEFVRELSGPGSGVVMWDSILRQLIHRLPLIFPLVWLAIYAGRNYTMAVRMEEDYAYKEAVSTAFEGYRREMGSIEPGVAHEKAPLNTLCGNVLATIYERPGRIYEGDHHDPTPATPLLSAIHKLTAQLKGGGEEKK